MAENQATNEKKLRIQGQDVTIYTERPVRVSCMEHIDRELDDYVDKYEVAPDTFKVDEIEDEQLDKKCMVCGQEGFVALLHVKGM